MRLESTWWSTELPRGWVAKHEESWVTLSHVRTHGALNISCVRKSDGVVAESDLREWASEQCPAEPAWSAAQFGPLLGIARERRDGDLYWWESFLACESLMYFTTYTSPLMMAHEQRLEVDAILSGIRERQHGA